MVVWSKELETGNKIIDGEHKELISHINALMEACKVGKGRAIVEESADFLLNYTKTHFAHEESLQVQHKFPDYTAHKKWHTDFMKKAEDVVKHVKLQGPSIGTVGEINSAAGILLAHIKSADAKLASHIGSK